MHSRPQRVSVESVAKASSGTLPRLARLDGVRALCFLLVFFSHAQIQSVSVGGISLWLFPGSLGVFVFFVLSGYLITRLLLAEHERSGTVSLRRFYLRRVLRLWAPLYVTIALAMVLASPRLLDVPWDRATVPYMLGQCLNYFSSFHHGEWPNVPLGMGILWSLAVEEHFYLLYPPLFLLLRRRRPETGLLLLVAACVLALAWRCVVAAQANNMGPYINVRSDTRFDSILFGALLAFVEKTRWNFVLDRWGKSLAVLGMAVLALTPLGRAPFFHDTVRYTLQGVAIAAVLSYVIRHGDSLVGRALGSSPLVFLGTISYTAYLSHRLALWAVDRAFGETSFRTAFVGLLVCIAYASLSYFAMEKPLARLRKTLA